VPSSPTERHHREVSNRVKVPENPMIKFKELYKNERYYSVGIDTETGEPVIEVTMTGIGWSDSYFRLTPEEFKSFQQDAGALDDLAERMAYDKGNQFYADRLLKRG
jgi:hypothetical protein